MNPTTQKNIPVRDLEFRDWLREQPRWVLQWGGLLLICAACAYLPVVLFSIFASWRHNLTNFVDVGITVAILLVAGAIGMRLRRPWLPFAAVVALFLAYHLALTALIGRTLLDTVRPAAALVAAPLLAGWIWPRYRRYAGFLDQGDVK
ncbi:hypothetical protein BH11ARM2_BH11ARM2_13810 [soil metagenome]